MTDSSRDQQAMARALELAARGQGHVEPNPMVGCVIVADGQIVGEGWHRRFGGPHAEREALDQAGAAAAGATMYVTLEPCCHHGKTPPCTDAILQSAVRRVVVAHRDPFPQVDGGGIGRLQAAGIEVETGLMAAESRELNAPYLKLVCRGRPWVIAKWAMTLDGKLAARSGDSRWISGESSRRRVHLLRGRMDAILVGAGTVAADNPSLTARPSGARTPVRIVLDSRAALPTDSQLVRTAREVPVLVVAGPQPPEENCRRLRDAGCEVWIGQADDPGQRLSELLDELGRRRTTNLLVEGGSQVLGNLFDAGLIDEVHVFVAAKLVGGAAAPSPLAGRGLEQMAQAIRLPRPEIEILDGDVYLHGRLK
ncbi:MAG: bifunctional diaminohydroxyphosphoribosylaminopyrimidine deaminase/5-amino-6-(5-phosphoribosylamino)uracil reductase RibD [Pirellulaceae bacterium]|nr:bifunctional diaminohydroxyphosphoribosylaminopyrimidine deaminase/5-amino-6-(5-phosphoribosylamino)uracil reductase RibD [Pirellulaceae bacterium]